MSYLFKQQFNISELVPSTAVVSSVVIVEPDIYLAKLAERYLVTLGYRSYNCPDLLLLEAFLGRVNPAVLLFNPEVCVSFDRAAGVIKKIIEDYPRLHIVTITHEISGKNLARIMSAGITSHINRKLTKPKDVAEIIKTLIINK